MNDKELNRKLFDTLDNETYSKLMVAFTKLNQEIEQLQKCEKKYNHTLGCNFAIKDKYKKENDELKSKIDKAIEYIENKNEYLDSENYYQVYEYRGKYLMPLLEILKGEE